MLRLSGCSWRDESLRIRSKDEEDLSEALPPVTSSSWLSCRFSLSVDISAALVSVGNGLKACSLPKQKDEFMNKMIYKIFSKMNLSRINGDLSILDDKD